VTTKAVGRADAGDDRQSQSEQLYTSQTNGP
jgi:hypothetical protein